jgi:hypothetical protein
VGEAKRHFQPVGQCIYCGRKDSLSDEHVIPFGLGGTLVLPKASCPSCADITKVFEQRLLRGHWWAYRRKVSMKSRHPTEQPDTFPVIFEYPSGETVREQISPQEYPFLLVCDFDEPSFLNGTVVPGVPIARVFLKLLVPAHEMPHVKRHGIQGIPKLTVEMNFSVEDFVRLLAKIALAYAIGRRSLPAFAEIFVKEIVLGSTDGALSYVGRSAIPSTSVGGAGHVHALREDTSGDLLTVYIVLFRKLDESMPVYQVVVGRLRR